MHLVDEWRLVMNAEEVGIRLEGETDANCDSALAECDGPSPSCRNEDRLTSPSSQICFGILVFPSSINKLMGRKKSF